MAKSIDDSAKGAAHIDVSKGGSKESLPDDVDNLDLDLGEEVEGEEKDEKKDDDGKKVEKKVAKKEEKSSDEEEEEEEGDEEEEEEEEEEQKKAKVKMVPQTRMMRIKSQRDTLQQQLAEAQQRIASLTNSSNKEKADQIAEFEKRVESMYEKLETERAAGNVKEAARLARELDKLKDEATNQRQKIIAETQTKQQLEMALYSNVLSQLEAQFPALNPDSDEYDEEIVADVDAITRGYESQGRSPSDALKAAARRVFGKDVFSERSMRRDESKQQEPRKVDRAKNAAAAKKQPPASAGDERSEKSQDLKVSNMSREEFNKLPEAVQNRLLGNEL